MEFPANLPVSINVTQSSKGTESYRKEEFEVEFLLPH